MDGRGPSWTTNRRVKIASAKAYHEAFRVVLASVTSKRPCRRKANRPPGQAALVAAAALAGEPRDVVVSLDEYARYAEAAR